MSTAETPALSLPPTAEAVAERVRDGGALPAWSEAELPEPPPFNLAGIRRMIGPGIIAIGMAVGAGEWLFGPVATVRYQGRLMCVVALVVFFQAILNTECIRYTLYTGEPIFTGYMRLRPGPRVWAGFFIGLDLMTSFWPGFAMTAATAVIAWRLGPDALPGPEQRLPTQIVATAIFLVLGALLLFGGKVYNAIERVMTYLIGAVFLFLLFVSVRYVEAGTWATLFRGFVSFDAIPEVYASGEMLVIGAFIAYAGLGGLGNATLSNYVRDKGWGMGQTVGAIPSAFGGQSGHLLHVGKVFSPTTENLKRWRGWWRYVAIDQYLVWGVGAMLGMILPGVVALQFLPQTADVSAWGAAAIQAQALEQAGGPIFWTLTLGCGFLVLLSTQLGAIEILPRRWTDLLWTASPRFRSWSPSRIAKVYYAIVGVYLAWCLSIVWTGVESPFFLVVIMANLGLFPIIPTCILTLIANRRFLPKALRPALWREVVLVATALTYLCFFLATVFLDERGLWNLIRGVL